MKIYAMNINETIASTRGLPPKQALTDNTSKTSWEASLGLTVITISLTSIDFRSAGSVPENF